MSLSALEAYREKLEIAKTPTPLWVYLYIYTKIDTKDAIYPWGDFRLIYNWIAPLSLPSLPVPAPAISNIKALRSWRISDIAKWIYRSQGKLEGLNEMQTRAKIEDVIMYSFIEEVLPKLKDNS